MAGAAELQLELVQCLAGLLAVADCKLTFFSEAPYKLVRVWSDSSCLPLHTCCLRSTRHRSSRRKAEDIKAVHVVDAVDAPQQIPWQVFSRSSSL